jgi:FMN phosphatase YigB (HAD superfamily)
VDIDAIAFDAFGTLFDLGELEERFKSTVVPWTWHTTVAGRFRPLPEIVAAAGIDPELVKSLPAFGDVGEALDALGHTPLAVLSNGTVEGIGALVRSAALVDRFEHLLAAEQVERYKPDPAVYGLATAAFATEARRVLLVSSNEWDVAGARLAGLSAAWVARGREPSWLMGIEADVVVDDLRGLARI